MLICVTLKSSHSIFVVLFSFLLFIPFAFLFYILFRLLIYKYAIFLLSLEFCLFQQVSLCKSFVDSARHLRTLPFDKTIFTKLMQNYLVFFKYQRKNQFFLFLERKKKYKACLHFTFFVRNGKNIVIKHIVIMPWAQTIAHYFYAYSKMIFSQTEINSPTTPTSPS